MWVGTLIARVRVLDAELDKFSHPIESDKKMVEAKARYSSM